MFQAVGIDSPKVMHLAVDENDRDLLPVFRVELLVVINRFLDETDLRKVGENVCHNHASIVTEVTSVAADEGYCAHASSLRMPKAPTEWQALSSIT